MNYFIRNKIEDFLFPYEELLNTAWFKLEKDYLEGDGYGFFTYNSMVYRLKNKKSLNDVPAYLNMFEFEKELPEDVSNYMASVDRYQEAKLALEGIFRKVTNLYNEDHAQMLSNWIPELPSDFLPPNHTYLNKVFKDLRENNIEQLEAIKKINIDRLLLK